MTNKEYQKHRYKTKYYPDYVAFMKFYPLTLDNLDGEEWRPISDYEELYQVSNYGRVKSFHKGSTRILKPALNVQGYLFVILYNKRKTFHARLSRLVAKVFIPNLDNKPEVNHIDGNKLNNYVENLEWVTSSENSKHSFAVGLQIGIRGANRSDSKLTNDEILFIRENSQNLNGTQLAKLFNVSDSTISSIQRGQKYKNSGGKIRGKYANHKGDYERIRTLYIKGSREFGTVALGKIFGLTPSAVWHIIHSK